MAKFAVVFIAALAFQAAFAAPKKTQGTAAGTGKTQLEEVAEHVQAVVNDITTSLQNVLPDSKQVTADLGKQSQEFAQNVQSIVNKLQAEIEKNKGVIDDRLQQISGKLAENIGHIKKAIGPDVTVKANEIKTALETNINNSAAELEKLVKVVQPNIQQAGDTITQFAKGILDDFLKATENLKKQIETTIQTSHKQPKH